MLALAALTPGAGAMIVQQRTPAPPESPLPTPPYADYADLVLAAPLIIDARVRSASRLKAEESAGLAPDHARFYVEADVLALVRGAGALPSRIGYVLDAALDARGRAPKLNKTRVLLFARPSPTAADQIQLVRADAQRSWDAGADALTRRIAREALAGDAPPAVTGVGNAFHVAGSLPGEGETQIFLATADGRPVSLNIQRGSGATPRWSVALSEVVDQAAGPPARDTLLWYRLACSLPPALPAASTESLDADAATIAREDYRFVVRSLGPCRAGDAL